MTDEGFDFGSAVSAVYSLLTEDDEPLPLDVVAGSETGRIPLEQSPALIFVRRAANELARGTISWDDFQERMERLYYKSRAQLEQFSQEIQDSLSQVDESTRQNALALEAGLSDIVEGCDRLLECGPENQEEVRAGLALIEDGFCKIDQADAGAHEQMAQAEGA